jgi:hypothetical protein
VLRLDLRSVWQGRERGGGRQLRNNRPTSVAPIALASLWAIMTDLMLRSVNFSNSALTRRERREEPNFMHGGAFFKATALPERTEGVLSSLEAEHVTLSGLHCDRGATELARALLSPAPPGPARREVLMVCRADMGVGGRRRRGLRLEVR